MTIVFVGFKGVEFKTEMEKLPKDIKLKDIEKMARDMGMDRVYFKLRPCFKTI